MRYRFSLKGLLIGISIFGACLFILVIFPTIQASRFVAGVNDGSIPISKEWSPPLADAPNETYGETTLAAKLLPRTWDDLFSVRRRIEVIETTPATMPEGSFYIKNALSLSMGIRRVWRTDNRPLLIRRPEKK